MSFTCIEDTELERLRARLHELEQRVAEPGCGEACPVALRLKAEVERLRDGMEVAWGVIANAGGGDWDTQGDVWKQAAARWRDEHWHPALDRRTALPGGDR